MTPLVGLKAKTLEGAAETAARAARAATEEVARVQAELRTVEAQARVLPAGEERRKAQAMAARLRTRLRKAQEALAQRTRETEGLHEGAQEARQREVAERAAAEHAAYVTRRQRVMELFRRAAGEADTLAGTIDAMLADGAQDPRYLPSPLMTFAAAAEGIVRWLRSAADAEEPTLR